METKLEIRIDVGMFVTISNTEINEILNDLDVTNDLHTIPQRGDAFDLMSFLRATEQKHIPKIQVQSINKIENYLEFNDFDPFYIREVDHRFYNKSGIVTQRITLRLSEMNDGVYTKLYLDGK